MAALTFKLDRQKQGFALYTSPEAESSDALASASFLLLPIDGAGDPPASLGLLDAWNQPGVFLFSVQPPPGTPSALAQSLELTPPYGTTRGLAWITSASTESFAFSWVPLLYMSPGIGQVAGASGTLPFGNIQLLFPSQTSVTFAADPPSATFNGDGILLQRADGQGAPVQPDAYQMTLSFAAAPPGGFTFTAQWDPYNLFSLFADDPQSPGLQGGEVRYFYPDAEAPSGQAQLRYPVLPPLPPGHWPNFVLSCEMAPLAPLDGTRTRFMFQEQTVNHLASPVGSTVSGQPVTLTPIAGATGPRAGLYPAARPDLGGGRAKAAYLAPIGPFTLSVPGGSAKMMCGTAGTEFLSVATGDVLEFVPSRPAYSAAFSPVAGARAARAARLNGAADTATLNATFNTSWVRFTSGAATAPRGYYAQPSASVSFGRGTLPKPMHYAAAVASLVSTLAPASQNEPSPHFPLVPYGSVFRLADGTEQDGATLASFEKQVLAPVRGGQIRGTTPDRPVFATEAGAPLPGTRTSTPQGLLVKLNAAPTTALAAAEAAPPAGTWQSLVLARSGSQYLSFEADPQTGVVDAKLASTLMREQLFMVLNNWTQFPNIARELTVGGFNFEIAPDPGDPAARATILVFKYATTLSLIDLIYATEDWADPAYFVGGGDQVSAAQTTLLNALKVANDARTDVDDPFGDFRQLAADPAWTGMLAFNAPINGNGMPSDLQMLFAGIDGQLKAHHFGVRMNRIRETTEPAPVPDISESSLFGVIYYGHGEAAARPPLVQVSPADPDQPDYVFTVEELAVTIANSAVTQFHCRVGMTIEKLFGREVTLAGVGNPADVPANTVVVAGQYQRHGAVGTVTFNVSEKGAFLFNPDGGRVRVLESFGVTGASLVPVTSQDTDKTVRSNFTLAGALAFAPDPFPGIKGLDLYSYGLGDAGAVEGVRIRGLSFAISFKLDATGKRDGPTTIAPDLTGLLAADNRLAQRKSALVRMLPLKLSAILHDPDGIDPKTLGAMEVNVPELMNAAVPQPGPGNGSTLTTQVAYVTSKPQYALQFAFPLGSLGALADGHASLDASLVLAWGPSTFTPDNDGAAVFVQLPQVTAGAFGFNLQGLLKTTFGDANLGMVKVNDQSVYVLMFNNVALSVLGITLPPKVITDFILFADAADPGGSNLGWSLAAMQTS